MDHRQAFSELLEKMVQAVVDRSEQVEILVRQGEQTTIFEIRVSKEDVGKVLGKKGSMINSFRMILRAYMAKYQFRAVLEILE